MDFDPNRWPSAQYEGVTSQDIGRPREDLLHQAVPWVSQLDIRHCWQQNSAMTVVGGELAVDHVSITVNTLNPAAGPVQKSATEATER